MLSAMRARALEKAGFARDYTDMRYRCSICKDEGYVGGKQCDCFKAYVRKEAYQSSKLFNLFESQGFDKFDLTFVFPTEVDKRPACPRRKRWRRRSLSASQFVEQFDSADYSLFFYGGVGLWENVFVDVYRERAVDRGNTVIYQSAAKLFSLLQRLSVWAGERGAGAYGAGPADGV